jgi:hypothetical protein
MIINEMMDSFWNDKISKEIMLSRYRDKVTNADLKISLEIAGKHKDEALLDNSFFVGFLFDLFDAEIRYILLDLILKKWHRRHEDIAGIFQKTLNTDKANIPVLLEAINTIPAYLQEEEFKYPYIRKIIYAIGAQPEPDNMEALKKLTLSDDEQIKALAIHQIEIRERLGRWEAKKRE